MTRSRATTRRPRPRVKTAQATLRLADLNLEFHQGPAPCDGRVSKQSIDPGNMVQADETPLTTIVTLDPIYAYFDDGRADAAATAAADAGGAS